MVDIVVRLTPPSTLQEVAQAVLDLLGFGANPDSAQAESMLGLVCTPEVNGHIRVRMHLQYLPAIQQAAAARPDLCEIVAVDPHGLFQVGEDEAGEPVYLGEFA